MRLRVSNFPTVVVERAEILEELTRRVDRRRETERTKGGNGRTESALPLLLPLSLSLPSFYSTKSLLTDLS